MITLKLDKTNQLLLKEKSFKRGHKKQRPIRSHTQESHENSKLKGVIYPRRTWCRPV